MAKKKGGHGILPINRKYITRAITNKRKWFENVPVSKNYAYVAPAWWKNDHIQLSQVPPPGNKYTRDEEKRIAKARSLLQYKLLRGLSAQGMRSTLPWG